ncbi:hypothetical protein [Novipirellula sp.]|uniref:hypothetical protein n=1 Tax=Novipirellula sp. TaxID=2795430 RepID=UPI00356A1A73
MAQTESVLWYSWEKSRWPTEKLVRQKNVLDAVVPALYFDLHLFVTHFFACLWASGEVDFIGLRGASICVHGSTVRRLPLVPRLARVVNCGVIAPWQFCHAALIRDP